MSADARERIAAEDAELIRNAAGALAHQWYPDSVARLRAAADRILSELQAPREALEAMEARKDAAYYERNQVVAALAKCFPSGVARTAIEGWSEDWHGCVYIDLPTGQVSWHFHDSQAHLFAGLPPYTKPWDGHNTDEKYRRVAALTAPAPQADALREALMQIRDCRGTTDQLDRAALALFYGSEGIPEIRGDWHRLSDEDRSTYRRQAGYVLAALSRPAGQGEAPAEVREEERCERCGWPLATDGVGCRPNDCSMRPLPPLRATEAPGERERQRRWSALRGRPSGSPTLLRGARHLTWTFSSRLSPRTATSFCAHQKRRDRRRRSPMPDSVAAVTSTGAPGSIRMVLAPTRGDYVRLRELQPNAERWLFRHWTEAYALRGLSPPGVVVITLRGWARRMPEDIKREFLAALAEWVAVRGGERIELSLLELEVLAGK